MAEIPAALPTIGELLAGKYRVTRLLGRGGMGAVFAAHHELLGQEVAIKVMLGESARDGDAVRRFLNEARSAASIRGEHVVRVYDVGQLDDGRPFISMELLDGEDLEHVLARNGALPPEVAVDYLLQAMEAVAQAHALGIVHRDLKPSNLFLTRHADGRPAVKVLDFGIAKALDPQAVAITSSQQTLGSPLYMSPEQVRSAKTADAQSDVWSLGAVLYELLTAAAPFAGQSLGELFLAIIETTPAPVHTRRPSVPTGLSEVVAHCLTRDRAGRVKNVAELAVDLRPYASSIGVLSADRISATTLHVASSGSLEPGSGESAAEIASAPTLPASAPELPSSKTADTWARSRDASMRRPTRRARVLGVSGLILAGALALVALRFRDRAPVSSVDSTRVSAPSASAATDATAALSQRPSPTVTDSRAVDASAATTTSAPSRPRPPSTSTKTRSTAPNTSASSTPSSDPFEFRKLGGGT